MDISDRNRRRDVTRKLNAIRMGEAPASDELMVTVYAELRRIAAGKMARERPGQALQATALVHEAWPEEAAEVLGISMRTAARDWDFARASLHREIDAR